MPAGGALHYQRWRAPRGHGEALVEPPRAEVAAALDRNRRRLAGQARLQYGSLANLQRQARHELFQIARQHTLSYRDDLPVPVPDAPIVMAGHQPELYHPGVWFKNFVLARLGQTHHAVPVNLLIDNDSLRTPAIRVPTGSPTSPRVELVAFDRPAQQVAYEERTIRDAVLFASFGERVAKAIRPLVPNPLVRDFWPLSVEAGRATGNVGLALAIARHRTEQQWGLHTWEAPFGAVCETVSFRQFLCELLGRAGEFHDIYNAALVDYRQVNRVRSRTHPVPELAQDGEWRELPLWVWSRENPLRRRLFARQQAKGIELTDRQSLRRQLSLGSDDSRAVEQLAEWSAAGVKLRPRALITTMFARLVLGDLFLHGIGGAKYDQLTDLILYRFLGIQPPDFLVLTATAHLPLDCDPVTPDELRGVERTLRQMRFNPEIFLNRQPDVESLIREKRGWIERRLPSGQRHVRYDAIRRINEQLHPRLAGEQARLLGERDRLRTRLRHQRLLQSREYSFCLFPEKTLRDLLLELSRESS